MTTSIERIREQVARVREEAFRSLPATFRAKVLLLSSGCWEWIGAKYSRGYGHYWNQETKRAGRAHLFAYQRLIGPVLGGLEMDHVKSLGCIGPSCVNPWHLEPVTHGVNVRRGNSPTAVNARKTHCVHGHEFTKENTRNEKLGRACKTCSNRLTREWYARRRAERILAECAEENGESDLPAGYTRVDPADGFGG